MKAKVDRDPGDPVNVKKKIVLRNSDNLGHRKKTIPVNSKSLLTMAMKLAVVSLQLLVLHSGVNPENTSPVEISIEGKLQIFVNKNNNSIGD
jgi:hypothetical protein